MMGLRTHGLAIIVMIVVMVMTAVMVMVWVILPNSHNNLS